MVQNGKLAANHNVSSLLVKPSEPCMDELGGTSNSETGMPVPGRFDFGSLGGTSNPETGMPVPGRFDFGSLL